MQSKHGYGFHKCQLKNNKQMTKEEIIDKYAFVERCESDFGQAPAYDFKYLAYGNAEKAMDEYAKQQAISFHNYLMRYAAYGDASPEFLYDLFIEQQSK